MPRGLKAAGLGSEPRTPSSSASATLHDSPPLSLRERRKCSPRALADTEGEKTGTLAGRALSRPSDASARKVGWAPRRRSGPTRHSDAETRARKALSLAVGGTRNASFLRLRIPTTRCTRAGRGLGAKRLGALHTHRAAPSRACPPLPRLSLGFLTCEMEYLGPGKSAQRRWSPPPRTWKARHSLRAAEGSGRRGLLERTPEQTSLPHQCKRGSVGHDRRPVIRPRGHAPAHAPAHRGRAATRPRSLLLDFYLSPLRET